MTLAGEHTIATDVVYDLQGTLLEACSCGILCPCWVGEDPDGGSCDAFNAYQFDSGTIDIQRAPIRHEVADGVGTLSVGDFLESEMAPYRGMDGTITTLRDSLFSTVPGSPAWVGKATVHNVRLPQYGMEWSLPDRNAIQAVYHMTHRSR